ncbi:MAG: hypothetical protein ABSF69_02130 [Polyangiaceae bacterium]
MTPRRADAWFSLAVALVVRLAVVAWAHGRFPAVEDGHYYDILARRLASGAGYTWLWPDGMITYAAHYPVGYPAILAAGYAIFGASTTVAMLIQAGLGAAGAYATHSLVDGPGVARWRPLAAALAVALHPALVPYTVAIMTEGVTASLLLVAAAFAARASASERAAPWLVALGIVMAAATLVRPQSLILAPMFGVFGAKAAAARAQRLARAAAVTAIALACIAPWTARNCWRMHRCALVSVNGGWNLLIGATTPSGGWAPVTVPAACSTVWDEAAKDSCFQRSALSEIAHAPEAWLARAPAKVAMTLDYFGAAPWYLHASNAGAFDDDARIVLLSFETIVCRLFLLGALVASARADGARMRARKGVAFAGAAATLTVHGWLGYVGVLTCLVLVGWRSLTRAPLVLPTTAAVILATVATHAAFFGSGRYGLVVAPFVGALAFAAPAVETRSSRG